MTTQQDDKGRMIADVMRRHGSDRDAEMFEKYGSGYIRLETRRDGAVVFSGDVSIDVRIDREPTISWSGSTRTIAETPFILATYREALAVAEEISAILGSSQRAVRS